MNHWNSFEHQMGGFNRRCQNTEKAVAKRSYRQCLAPQTQTQSHYKTHPTKWKWKDTLSLCTKIQHTHTHTHANGREIAKHSENRVRTWKTVRSFYYIKQWQWFTFTYVHFLPVPKPFQLNGNQAVKTHTHTFTLQMSIHKSTYSRSTFLCIDRKEREWKKMFYSILPIGFHWLNPRPSIWFRHLCTLSSFQRYHSLSFAIQRWPCLN